MKRFILIESDTEYHSLSAYSLEQIGGKYGNVFVRQEHQDAVVSDSRNGQFFGGVRALLATKDDVAKPTPIELVSPAPVAMGE